MKKNSLIVIIVIFLLLFVWLLADRYRYGTFMHRGWMQNMGMHQNIGGVDMMQHVDISSEEEFIKHMIPHHQEAVDTATALYAITQYPALKELTANIVVAQTSEIVIMEERLQNRYATGTVQVAYQPMMRDSSTISAITTIERMRLEDMIGHHMGAVMMAQQVLRHNPRPEVESFAQDVIRVQSEEIDLMKMLLSQ